MADVSTPTPQYNVCVQAWRTVDALWGGTRTMRDAGEQYLPREKAESVKHYTDRLNRSVLFNGYRDAITRISSKPFSRTITLTQWESLDTRLQDIEEDCDRRGTSITQFGRDLLEDALKYGAAHFIVDYPSGVAGASLADEREQAIRPYFVRVSPVDAIEVSDARVRVKEKFCESDGEWGVKEVEQVRVYQPGEWAIYTKSESTYTSNSDGTTPLKTTPVVSVYLRRKCDGYAEPTMEDLVWLNIAHWQSSSDQRNLLHVARVPILYEQGVSPKDIETELVIGSDAVRRTSKIPAECDLKWVEPTGAAMQAGSDDVKDLERRMEVLGIQPFIRQTGDATATAAAIGESNVDSDVQSWIRLIEGAIYRGYEMAAEWIGAQLPEEFAVDIWNEFGLSTRAQQDGALILQLRAMGDLDQEATLLEFQRRGIISDAVDISAQVEAAGMNADLAAMGDPAQAA